MKKLLLHAALISIGFISYAHAATPDQCPSVDAIQHVALVNVTQKPQADNKWGGYQLNNKYDTEDAWDLVIAAVSADNVQEATQKLTEALSTLMLVIGPTEEDNGVSVCLYQGGKSGVTAIAFTPPLISQGKDSGFAIKMMRKSV